MNMVLVTGSQGFIGSYLCQELLNRGNLVVGIDNYSKYGKVARPHDKHPNFILHKIDIVKDPVAFSTTCGYYRPDYMIAGAAMIGGISYFHKYAYDLLATNERITANTFDVALRLHKNGWLKKIVVISSSMVFENTTFFPTSEGETKICPAPSSTYGFQKLATEYFAKGAWQQYRLPYTICRPFNCVGVGEDKALGEDEVTQGNIKMMLSHVLPDLINKSLKLNKYSVLPILGNGEQIRHYTHGKDIARGIVMAMESSLSACEDYNISSPVSTSVKELATMVWRKINGCDPIFKYEDPFKHDVQKRIPDVKKAKDELGFETKISLEESVDEVIEYMRKKQWTYQ